MVPVISYICKCLVTHCESYFEVFLIYRLHTYVPYDLSKARCGFYAVFTVTNYMFPLAGRGVVCGSPAGPQYSEGCDGQTDFLLV